MIMFCRKQAAAAFFAVCAVISLCSCPLDKAESAPWSADSVTWNYSASDPVYELPQNVETVSFSASTPVDIFFARMNPSSAVVDGLKTRYLSSAVSRSADVIGSISGTPDFSEFEGSSAEFIRRDFEPAQQFVPQLDLNGSARFAVSEPQRAVTQITPNVDVTKKDVWVDVAAGTAGSVQSGTSYLLQKRATLRAAGTHCYVWIVDGYYAVSASDARVSSATATAVQGKFDAMYPLIRNVFGNEAEHMVAGTSQNPTPAVMTEVSDTGSKVNIVLYDIEGDYKAGQMSGTFGYFWAKDYYVRGFSADAPVAQSNEGKYFYVDSYFANEQPDMIYSTLAHEFQHMIHFGVKALTPEATGAGSGAISETWYNEMLSMLCEDMMQSHLGIGDEKSPKSRLAQFCAAYPLSGITDWLSGNNVLQSYANAFAFGAYLARNYGGPDLVKAIAQNASVDQASVTEALQSAGFAESFNSVFTKFARALVFTDPPAGYPSFNKSVSAASAFSGYTYPMTAIDLLGLRWSDSSSGTVYIGPAMFKVGSEGRITLRPYGLTLHAVGHTTSAGTIELKFSQPISSAEKIYVMVRPRA
ncbi:peptidase M30 [Treponema brennaborense]|uniref:Peptidase M30, hyicolysin n=1 Tax=Treponema brennaborense (strain DSM 12168 / CIP 105900 / DD5/3) TaxID=906968 RepID=F4LMB7_TREBD|nr:peptidase M30 [Treponema brennaborense]AEE17783.1 Peptidase M30, hyicolysin [Treponema brennaborense DSM 12168]